MHRLRSLFATTPHPPAPGRLAWTKDFAIGWLAGLIFFGTMLS